MCDNNTLPRETMTDQTRKDSIECQFAAIKHCSVTDPYSEALVYTKCSNTATFAVLANDGDNPENTDTHAANALALFSDLLASPRNSFTFASSTNGPPSPRNRSALERMKMLQRAPHAPANWCTVFVNQDEVLIAGRGMFFCPLVGLPDAARHIHERDKDGCFALGYRISQCKHAQSFALAVALSVRQRFNVQDAHALLDSARVHFSNADNVAQLFVKHLVRDASFCVFSLLARTTTAEEDAVSIHFARENRHNNKKNTVFANDISEEEDTVSIGNACSSGSLGESPKRRTTLKVIDSESTHIPRQRTTMARRTLRFSGERCFSAVQRSRSDSDSGSATMSMSTTDKSTSFATTL